MNIDWMLTDQEIAGILEHGDERDVNEVQKAKKKAYLKEHPNKMLDDIRLTKEEIKDIVHFEYTPAKFYIDLANASTDKANKQWIK